MPTRNERLADHYLRAAGVAGVYVEACDPRPRVGYLCPVTIEQPEGRVLLCCRAPHAMHIARLAHLLICDGADVAGAAGILRALANEHGIGLTPHETVIQRASEAVQRVNATFDAMKGKPGMITINRQFKAQRKRGGIATYADFLHARKALMLEAMASVKK